MPRPIWNGVISFGLLNVPVSLYSGERKVDLHFRMIDSRSKKPIRYERVNADTGEEVPWKDIVQAFEYEKGNYVVLSKEDLAKVAPQGKETIEIEAFVERQSIQASFFEKPYYLVAGKKAEKGYALLRAILRNTDRVGIGYVLIRTRRYLAAVLPQGDALVLNLLRFAQELVPEDSFIFPDDDLERLRITKRELDMATQLIDSMTVQWHPADYADDYRERLSKIVEQRLAQRQGLVHEEEHEESALPENAATNVVDFMALLQKSLENKPARSAAARKSSAASAEKKPAKGAGAKDSDKKAAAKKKAEPASKAASAKKVVTRKAPPRKTTVAKKSEAKR